MKSANNHNKLGPRVKDKRNLKHGNEISVLGRGTFVVFNPDGPTVINVNQWNKRHLNNTQLYTFQYPIQNIRKTGRTHNGNGTERRIKAVLSQHENALAQAFAQAGYNINRYGNGNKFITHRGIPF